MNISGRSMVLIDDLLTPEECTRFIRMLDTEGLHRVHTQGLATYDRAIWTDSNFAAELYGRIQAHLPPGTVGCNEVFRFSKYHPGQEFKIHTDGTNQDARGNRSCYTLNIFLNADFTGGETDFFEDGGARVVRAIPQPGRAALFDRGILHCGNKVTSGNKYLLRTDVMVPIPGAARNSADDKVFTYTVADHIRP